jgi:hypothetical protein
MPGPENEVDAQIREEFEFHVARCARELEDSGMPREAAIEEARRRFGDPRQHWDACRREAPEERMRKAMIGGLAVALVVACAAIVVLGYSVMRQGEALARIEEDLAKRGDASATSEPAKSPGVVYLDGAVRRPGVYNLPEVGELTVSRLVAAAGGARTGVPFVARLVPQTDSVVRIAQWQGAGGAIETWKGQTCLLIENGLRATAGADPALRAGDMLVVGEVRAEAVSDATPEMQPLTPEQVHAMSKAEVRAMLSRVAQWRSRGGLSEETKDRLKREFDMLLEAAAHQP